jgi:regulation of enolase protein 1 (concanavalin A-like superfamily)
MKWAVGTLYDAVFQHHGLSVLLNDGSHGWAGGNHMAWNVEAHGIEFDRPPTAHQWVHGSISTSSNLGDVRSGALATEVVSWQSHIDPRSLYRAQLAERVGAQKVLAALGQPYGANYFVVTPATNTVSAAAGQNTALPVVLTVVKNYPDTTVIPNVTGSVAVPNWPNSNVTFTVSGLPFGCAASFNSPSLNVAGTNLLNITASNNAPAGNYLVTVKGSSAFPTIRGGVSPLNQSATFVLNVTSSNNFFLSADPYYQTVDPGTNTTFTVKVTGTNGFGGNVPLNVLGLPAGVGAAFNPPSVTGSGSSALTLTASNNAPPGLYTLTIIGTNAGLAAGATVKLGIGLTAGLPAPWDNADIGSPPLAGSANWTNGTFTLKGCGADIWSTSDQFQFAWQEQPGDFTITARVASQSNTDPWAKAGVMIRESTNTNSKFIGLYVTPTSSHGLSLQYRASTGGGAVDSAQISGPAVPYWVRLARSGNTFTAWHSSGGQAWTQAGTNITAINLPTNALAGLAVCSHNPAALGTVTFDNVSLVEPDFFITPSPLSQAIVGGDSTNFIVIVTGTNNFTGVVTLSVDGLPDDASASFNPPAINTSGSSTLTVTTTNVTVPDDYQLAISGTGGALVNQAAVTLTVLPADSDGDGLPDYWMLQYFGHITAQAADQSRATDDPDSDGMSNLAEYLCGTSPISAQSSFRLVSATPLGNDISVSWLGVGGKTYVVEAATNLTAPYPFTDASPPIGIVGTGESIAAFLHPNAATNTTLFYRIRVEP